MFGLCFVIVVLQPPFPTLIGLRIVTHIRSTHQPTAVDLLVP